MKPALRLDYSNFFRWLSCAFAVQCSLAVVGMGTPARAQTGAQGESDANLDEEAADDEEEYVEEEPTLRAPVVESIDLTRGDEVTESGEYVEEPEEEGLEEDESEGDDEDADQPLEELPPADAVDQRDQRPGDPTIEAWTRPQTVFELHGYMRMRGEFQDQFSLGRAPELDGDPDYPFALFIPREDASYTATSSTGGGTGTIVGGCAGGRSTTAGNCNQRALAFANMRLRLEPTIHLSDDVRVHMQIDVFDNLVMGSTPEGYGIFGSDATRGSYDFSQGQRWRSSYVPLTAFAQTQQPPSAGYNSWSDSIVVRRAWAEVGNRGLGELRFGRMPNHWGLGILANGGAGLDSDFQSDVDRIMAVTRLVGLYFFGAWDFASEGMIYDNPTDRRVPFDWVRNDDVDQFTFGVARRATPEEQTAALQHGDFVLNAGAYFIYRTQNLTSEGVIDPLNPAASPVTLARRGFEVYVPDLWIQFLWDKLRLEAEAVMQIGTIDNPWIPGSGSSSSFDTTRKLNILQFGFAFEGEYHLLNDQLGIYFNTGYATGDADVEGLTSSSGSLNELQLTRQNGADRNLTAFGFHPNYRIDMIFWRTIMRQFGSAYYFRPGVSYDFIRSRFGQLLGARADLIYSRASEPVQAYGNSADLGLELDIQAYYRSEDGPDLLDGFYASFQYGVFFPFQGLGYIETNRPTGAFLGGQTAHNLRLILGVQF